MADSSIGDLAMLLHLLLFVSCIVVILLCLMIVPFAGLHAAYLNVELK